MQVSYEKSLSTQMVKFLDDGSYCDVSFIVQGKKIAAHRLILLQSPTFATEYGAKETKLEIVLNDWSYDSFRSFVRILYGAPTIIEKENVVEILRICKYYKLEDLTEKCKKLVTLLTIRYATPFKNYRCKLCFPYIEPRRTIRTLCFSQRLPPIYFR
jgi:hypothetical protein